MPFADDLYARARPKLRLAAAQTLKLDEHTGLHTALRGFKGEYDAGRLAIVQNAGYPNPNRSHFRSMEIWQTASQDPLARDGWIGRYFDAQCSGEDPRRRPGSIGLGFGKVMPQALRNRSNVGIALSNPDAFQWNPSGETATLVENQRAIFSRLNQPGRGGAASLDFLRHTAMNAVVAGDQIRALLRREDRRGAYPNTELAAQLRIVARLIAGDFPARVYYVSQGGYDTHAAQGPQHARLLGDFSAAVTAFLDDLRKEKTSDRVAVLAFSEFGRRVAENGSAGTDHGAAAPLFVLGDAVKGGLQGGRPDLADLEDGDVRHKVDFRQVYSALLANWLGTPPEKVLGRTYEPLGIV